MTQTAVRLKSSHTHLSVRWLIQITNDLKKEALSIRCVVQSLVEEEDTEEIRGVLNAMSIFNQVTPEDMVQEQCKHHFLGVVCPYVAREKLKTNLDCIEIFTAF